MSDCSNIYKSARTAAGLTQDKASELLYISVRSVADYEAGKTIPGDDVVNRMIEIYNCKELAWLHITTSSEVGKKHLPKISFLNLPLSVLCFEKEIDDVLEVSKLLRNIACDGLIDNSEISKWEKVKKEIAEVACAAIGLMFIK